MTTALAVNSTDINFDTAETPEIEEYVPQGKYIKLPGRGRFFYREHKNIGKPTVILLHGMIASSGLNWFKCYESLSKHFHIIAPDFRGHGRSARKTRNFKITSCAKDIAALITTLRLQNVILVGYSMGGAVAQHVCRRYPQLVAGMVLSGTGFHQEKGPRNHFIIIPLINAIVGVSRLGELALRLPNSIRLMWFPNSDPAEFQSRRAWLMDELRRTPARVTIEAAREMLAHDTGSWLGELKVPAAVLVTLQDGAFSATHQREMANRLPDAAVFEIDLGHTATARDEYAPALVEACLDVSGRIDKAKRKTTTGKIKKVK